jgi:hypothetical protein
MTYSTLPKIDSSLTTPLIKILKNLKLPFGANVQIFTDLLVHVLCCGQTWEASLAKAKGSRNTTKHTHTKQIRTEQMNTRSQTWAVQFQVELG